MWRIAATSTPGRFSLALEKRPGDEVGIAAFRFRDITRLLMDSFIQITVFGQPKPLADAFLHRNAEKI